MNIPFAWANQNRAVVVQDGDSYHIYCEANVSFAALAELKRQLPGNVPLDIVENEEFERILLETYHQENNQTQKVMEDLGNDLDFYSLAEELPEQQDLLDEQDDAPVIRLINAMLSEAIKERASDIHIETYENELVIRFRIDGVLKSILKPQRKLAALLVSRIKVMSRLDIAEKRVPQDGRISLRIAGRPVDVRVSVLPTSHGERVVMRLLDKSNVSLDLSALGMQEERLATLSGMVQQPHGIVLVTGPTGSGKSTTLYAMLQSINDGNRNIMTVEDPVEFELTGISQTQVNTKVGMTFAMGLRALLRQDPDVVLIGEIRDAETAQIAVQASLTGHLVMSTLHTNTAVGAISRLRDMGVEPWLLASSLSGVLAQRLLRRLCKHCRQKYELSRDDCNMLQLPEGVWHAWQPAGCEECNGLGYRGRLAIHELLRVDDKVRHAIHTGASESELQIVGGMEGNSLRDDGIRKLLAGETSLDELLRVTAEDNRGEI